MHRENAPFVNALNGCEIAMAHRRSFPGFQMIELGDELPYVVKLSGELFNFYHSPRPQHSKPQVVEDFRCSLIKRSNSIEP